MLVVGETSVDVCYNKQVKTLKLYVVDPEGPSLFGRDWLQHIRLDWKTIGLTTAEINESCVNPVLERYSDVFSTELGTIIKDVKAKLEVKPDVIPLFNRPRPVPFSMKPMIDIELDRLEKAGILEKVTHSDWASPIVPVPKKDGCIRICGDYKVSVNQSLIVDQHPLPNPEELYTTLTGGQ